MRIPKALTLFLLLVILMSGMQVSNSRLVNHDATHAYLERRSETKNSSMLTQSLSAILSSLNTNKDKFKHIQAVSRRFVPAGPNPLHNGHNGR
ncbi:hypothetical protein RIF29_23697 [Crotalaria pallida]|uniref:Uncharacterized protein n=1 Tax=Crotalaria pallida TaxID=3830 RepID=A0AAN9I7L1_CROPI